MRLIDASSFAVHVVLYMAENAYLNDTALDVLKKVSKWLEEEPTLDYAPVKRGKWIPWYKEDKNPKTGFPRGLRQFGWSCSACHCRSGIRTKFCPGCGALMDGKDV